MDQRDQGAHLHQPPADLDGVPDALRAEAARPDAAALRPEPRRPEGHPPALRRPDQDGAQGGVRADGGDRHPLPDGARVLGVHRARRLQRHPVGRGLADLALPRERRGHGRADLADPDLRARLARDLRLHHRRLGLRVEVLAARLDADLRADGLVRGLAGAVGARRRADGAHALAVRDRRRAGQGLVVRRAAVRRPRLLLHRGDRGDEPAAVRPARGRHRARRRLPTRVLRHALGPVPDGRVRERDRDLVARRSPSTSAAGKARGRRSGRSGSSSSSCS